MKKTIKLLFVAISLLLSKSVMATENIIDSSQLPKKVVQFIQKYYSKEKMSIINFEKNFFSGDEYEVILTNGTLIEFNEDGEWKDIECKNSNIVHMEIIDKRITEVIKKKFPSNNVIKIERSSRDTEIELDNDIELIFNKNEALVRIDR